MGSTALVIGFFLILFLANLFCCALLLRWGARWFARADLTSRKSLGLVVLLAVLGGIVQFGAKLTLSYLPQEGPVVLFGQAIAIAFSLLTAYLTCAILAYVLNVRILRAFLVWLLMSLPGIASLCLVIFVVRPHVFEAFSIPTNAMAPTLMGPHCLTTCPECRGPAVGSALPARTKNVPTGHVVICTEHFHTSRVAEPFEHVPTSDRILVNKLLRPRRWDMLVFKFPEDPAVNYVMRVVGLSGEEVVIRDGAVWIDGQKQEPPEALQGLRYTTTFDVSAAEMPWARIWGAEEHAAKLGPGAYFVLGDFSENARDSRLWEFGAEGHPPFAVPESHIIGVVTQTYWPPSRWRAFR